MLASNDAPSPKKLESIDLEMKLLCRKIALRILAKRRLSMKGEHEHDESDEAKAGTRLWTFREEEAAACEEDGAWHAMELQFRVRVTAVCPAANPRLAIVMNQ